MKPAKGHLIKISLFITLLTACCLAAFFCTHVLFNRLCYVTDAVQYSLSQAGDYAGWLSRK